MVEVKFHKQGTVDQLKIFVVAIMARYRNKWIMVRHNQRRTWELPGGRREANETVNYTAVRELFEETGARRFTLYSIGPYSVIMDSVETFGEIFYAEVSELGPLPAFEIAEISLVEKIPVNLTYPVIQIPIFQRVLGYDILTLKDKGVEYSY